MYKLLLSWDIKPSRDQEYFEFMVREFAPRITSMGVTPTEAWFSVYGNGPQITVEGITEDFETMKKVLESREWKELKARLLTFVDDYQQKVVTGRPDIQI
ncbi:MAG: hypothetical protein KJ064_02235 [Anaerolineae bacterium]|jgi:hypothetical protein|nr:hypothetical protein [Anaerolineae bacterium]